MAGITLGGEQSKSEEVGREEGRQLWWSLAGATSLIGGGGSGRREVQGGEAVAVDGLQC
jgi:hypothetical protein